MENTKTVSLVTNIQKRGEFMEIYGVIKGEKKKKKSTVKKYICPICEESVKATKSVHIRCGDCNFRMVIAG